MGKPVPSPRSVFEHCLETAAGVRDRGQVHQGVEHATSESSSVSTLLLLLDLLWITGFRGSQHNQFICILSG